jgi:OFA family oxalate/formate antiporter-like MFS transporter
MFRRVKERLFYGWIVVASIFFVGTTIWGLRFSFGVFFKSIEAEFNLSRGATSAIFSIYMVLVSVFAILGGWILDRYGPRIIVLLMGIVTGSGLLLTSQASAIWQLYISYSLLLSIGTSSMYVVAISTVSKWFDKKRGVALGIASSGAGLGAAIVAPFAAYLISSFGWQTAYAIIGVIVLLVLVPLSRLLKKGPYELGVLPDGIKIGLINKQPQKLESEDRIAQSTGLSVFQAFKTKSFWLITLTQLLYASGFFLASTHIVPHAIDKGISIIEASSILSVIGITGIIGRITMGIVSDRIGSKATVVICITIHTLALTSLIWVRDLQMLYMFSFMFGLAWGGIVPAMGALIVNTFGLGKLGSILGVIDVGFGIGAAIGPVIGGLIFDIMHSYLLAFLLAAVTMLIGIVFIALVRREISMDISHNINAN